MAPAMRHRGLALVVVSALLLALVAATGLLYVRTRAAQEQVRAFVERALVKAMTLPVRVDRVSLSPGVGRVDVRNLTVTDRTGEVPLLVVDRVRVSLALLSLLRGEFRVKSLAIREPRLSGEDAELRAVLLGLLARIGEPSGAGMAGRVPVRVRRGAVVYRNSATGVSVEVSGLDARLTWPSREEATAVVDADLIQARFGSRVVDGVGLHARAHLGREVTELEELRLDRGRSTLTLSGMILTPKGPPRVDLSATGELVLEDLASVLAAGGEWRGRLSVSGKLFGEGLSQTFEGRVALVDGSVAGVRAPLATGTLVLRPERWEVLSVSAQAAGGTLLGSGLFEPSAGRWQASAQLTDVHLGDLLQALGRPGKLVGRVSGRAEGSGQGTDPRGLELRADLAGHELRLADGKRKAEAETLLILREGLLRVQRFAVRHGRSWLTLRGTVDLTTDALALTARATVADLALDAWPVAVEGLGGRLRLSGRVEQNLKTPRFAGEMSVTDLSVAGWRADLVEGSLDVDPARLASRGLRVSVGKTTATLSGEARLAESALGWARWREQLQLSIEANLAGRIEDLVAWTRQDLGAAGPLALQARLAGTPARPEGRGQLEMTELRLGSERFEALRASLVLKGTTVSIPRLAVRKNGVMVQAEGAIDTGGRYRFSLLPLKLDLGAIPHAAALGAEGNLMLRAWGAGQWPEARVEGEVTLADSAFRHIPVGDGRARFTLDGGQWRWTLDLAQGVNAQGTAPQALRGPIQVEIAGTDVDLAPFFWEVREQLPFSLSARANGRATLRGALPELRTLTGRIELTNLRGQAGDVPWRGRDTVRLSLEAGALHFESVDVVGPGLSVGIQGSIHPREQTDLVLSGYAPYVIAKGWVPTLADFRGQHEVRLSLVGPPGKLKVAGHVDARQFDVKPQAIPIWVSIASGEAEFDDRGVRYEILEGAVAGGRLEGQGTVQREGDHWQSTIEFKLDKAQLATIYDQLQWQSGWATGELFMRGSLTVDAPVQGQLPLSTLRGQVSVTLEGGSLSRYPALVRIFGLLGSPTQPHRLPDLTKERMPYRQISADFLVTDGVMETKNLVLDSEVVRVSGVGRLRLSDQTTDLNLAVRPLQVLEQGIRKIPILGRVLPEEQSLVVTYFDIEGPWADPKISVAPVKSLGKTVADILLLLIKAPGRVIIPKP